MDLLPVQNLQRLQSGGSGKQLVGRIGQVDPQGLHDVGLVVANQKIGHKNPSLFVVVPIVPENPPLGKMVCN